MPAKIFKWEMLKELEFHEKTGNVASYSDGVMECECLVSLILSVSSSDNYDLLDTLISCSVSSLKKMDLMINLIY